MKNLKQKSTVNGVFFVGMCGGTGFFMRRA